MEIRKLNKSEQQSIRVGHQQIMSSLHLPLPNTSLGLFREVNKDAGEILLLVRFSHSTNTLNIQFKNAIVEWWLPCIPVLGIVVNEDNKNGVVNEIIAHPEFNNIVEVEYFDEDSFIDIPLIGNTY